MRIGAVNGRGVPVGFADVGTMFLCRCVCCLFRIVFPSHGVWLRKFGIMFTNSLSYFVIFKIKVRALKISGF